MDKMDALIKKLNEEGHSVQMVQQYGKWWYEIDRNMRATDEEMEELADGVYSLSELEELFKKRRAEEQGKQ